MEVLILVASLSNPYQRLLCHSLVLQEFYLTIMDATYSIPAARVTPKL